jgi:small subunit ribosomal protein S1
VSEQNPDPTTPTDFAAILDAFEQTHGSSNLAAKGEARPEPPPGKAGAAQAQDDALAALTLAHTEGTTVEGLVMEVVKGGVSVNITGIRCFCPISQLDRYTAGDGAEYVGRRLPFRITRLEPAGRGRGPNIVISRRVLIEEEAQVRAAETRATLQVGATVRGTVSSLATFGAFVDLGGLEGLIPVSELAHTRVEHPQDLLTVGQEVEVKILALEPARGGKSGERITLSRRALLADPWQAEAGELKIGSRRQGKVQRLEPFGAFIELVPGVDGLLHVSELGGDRRIQHPRDVVQPGQTLEVVVREVDLAKKRISLTLPGNANDPAEAMPADFVPSSGGSFAALGDLLKKAGIKTSG